MKMRATFCLANIDVLPSAKTICGLPFVYLAWGPLELILAAQASLTNGPS